MLTSYDELTDFTKARVENIGLKWLVDPFGTPLPAARGIGLPFDTEVDIPKTGDRPKFLDVVYLADWARALYETGIRTSSVASDFFLDHGIGPSLSGYRWFARHMKNSIQDSVDGSEYGMVLRWDDPPVGQWVEICGISMDESGIDWTGEATFSGTESANSLYYGKRHRSTKEPPPVPSVTSSYREWKSLLVEGREWSDERGLEGFPVPDLTIRVVLGEKLDGVSFVPTEREPDGGMVSSDAVLAMYSDLTRLHVCVKSPYVADRNWIIANSKYTIYDSSTNVLYDYDGTERPDEPQTNDYSDSGSVRAYPDLVGIGWSLGLSGLPPDVGSFSMSRKRESTTATTDNTFWRDSYGNYEVRKSRDLRQEYRMSVSITPNERFRIRVGMNADAMKYELAGAYVVVFAVSFSERGSTTTEWFRDSNYRSVGSKVTGGFSARSTAFAKLVKAEAEADGNSYVLTFDIPKADSIPSPTKGKDVSDIIENYSDYEYPKDARDLAHSAGKTDYMWRDEHKGVVRIGPVFLDFDLKHKI